MLYRDICYLCKTGYPLQLKRIKSSLIKHYKFQCLDRISSIETETIKFNKEAVGALIRKKLRLIGRNYWNGTKLFHT